MAPPTGAADVDTHAKSAERTGISATSDNAATTVREHNGATAIGTTASDYQLNLAPAHQALEKLGLGNFQITDAGANVTGRATFDVDPQGMGLGRPKVEAHKDSAGDADLQAMGFIRPTVQAPDGLATGKTGDAPLPHDNGRDPRPEPAKPGAAAADAPSQGFTRPALFPEWHPPTEATKQDGDVKLSSGDKLHSTADKDVVTRPNGTRVEVNADGPVFYNAQGQEMPLHNQNDKFSGSPQVLDDGTTVSGYNFQQFTGSGSIRFPDGDQLKISNGRIDVDKTEGASWNAQVAKEEEKRDPAKLGNKWDEAYKTHDYAGMNKAASQAGAALTEELAAFPASYKSTADTVKEFGNTVNENIATEGKGLAFVLQHDNLRIIQVNAISDPQRLQGLAAEMSLHGEADLNKKGIYRYEGGFVERMPNTMDHILTVPHRADESKAFMPGMR